MQTWLPWFLRGILFLALFIIFGRLLELQVVKGQYFRLLADENRIKRITLVAPRGRLLARGGEPLLGEKVAHLTGYLGEANEDEVGRIDPDCLEKGARKLGSLVGRAGLEKQYNCLLSGFDGEELVEVDTLGQPVRLLGRREPIAGQDIKTNINLPLQTAVAKALAGQKGAVVVSDAKGEIMALYSSPTFASQQLPAVLDDPEKPLFNRAIAGLYHPGSTFKLLVSLVGLEEGVVDANYFYEDPGVLRLQTQYGDYAYSNWYFDQYGKTEGKINIVRALTRSCDTFFYNLGELVGIEKLVAWSRKLKLDQTTGLDLPGEAAGFVPSPIWKEKTRGEKWFLGNTYHLSIGQGDLALTPLQVNSLTSIVASGGYLCQARIVGQAECQDLHLKPGTLTLIKEGLAGACRPGGTGYPFFDLEGVACKTGTAETSIKGVTHAWFTVFYPLDLPEIVVTVLLEEGGEGSTAAGPLARQIIDAWRLQQEP